LYLFTQGIAASRRNRQTRHLSRRIDLLTALIIALSVLTPIILFIWWRERRWSARTKALRTILDRADELESDLQECRIRLREIPSLINHLPPSHTLSARATLTAEPQVQAALHDLLQHRLWLRDHAADASLEALQAAALALGQSRDRLSEQLIRLGEVKAELVDARSSSGVTAEAVSRER
jgi:hypothetical protein